jgi:hypothetical protein
MSKLYILVEGHGEVRAVQNLLTRVSHAMECFSPWATPLRWQNLHQWESVRGGIRKGADFIRGKSDVGGLLILRDEDDGCPAYLAPGIAGRLQGMDLPFPVAYVLLHPEYEVLFLPCIERMTGQFPDGRNYKPIMDQLIMTQKIDLPTLRAADVPSFGSLERAVRLLCRNIGNSRQVYPDVEGA